MTTTLHVTETCPCGATYTSGRHRDPTLWEAWANAHRPHGLRTEENP